MLVIVVKKNSEFFNEKELRFETNLLNVKIKLEHSLISISNWEAYHKKSFFASKNVDILDYARYMTINNDVPPEVYTVLTSKDLERIKLYINDPMTATTFSNTNRLASSRSIITNELIYYWMILFGIPKSCEKWHINRLLTLINICAIKAEPSKKMSKQSLLRRNSKLNAQRRKAMKTKG